MEGLAYLLNELTDKNLTATTRMVKTTEITIDHPVFTKAGYGRVASIDDEKKEVMFYFPYDVPGVSIPELEPLIRFFSENGYKTNRRRRVKKERSQ